MWLPCHSGQPNPPTDRREVVSGDHTACWGLEGVRRVSINVTDHCDQEKRFFSEFSRVCIKAL